MSPRRALLLIAVAASVAPATAAAQADAPVFDAALAAGAAHWGEMPCGGDVSYRWAELPDGILGYAEWTRPAESTDPKSFSSCRIDLPAGADFEPAMLCTVLAHELGHLHGHAHVDDDADLMAESVGDPLPSCVAAMQPFVAASEPAVTTWAPVAAARPAATRGARKHSRAKHARKRARYAKRARAA